MHFYVKYKYICFSWIFNFVWIAADNIKFGNVPPCPAELFRIVNLGHSSLLISWDPQEIHKFISSKDKTLGEYEIEFQWFFENVKNGSTVCNNYDHNLKISSLRENTTYKFQIDMKKYYKTCWIEGKTIFNSNPSIPTKPYFKFGAHINLLKIGRVVSQPMTVIIWFPCGRKGYCEKEEVAGSHFSVKYKMLESRQEWRTYEYNESYKLLYGLLPGRPYEIIVTSISARNANLQTDSDPQEMIIKPVCSSVRSVQIITLTNSSVYIFWKKHKQCQLNTDPAPAYVVFYRVFDSSPVILLDYTNDELPYEETKFIHDHRAEFNRGVKILNLKPGISYTFYIIPQTIEGLYGTEYRIDYTPHIYPVNLPLARPEFSYEFYDLQKCSVTIYWFPCGITHECKDTRPGSYFVIKYRKETDQSDWEEIAKRDALYTIYLFPNNMYTMWIESRDEFNNSENSVKQAISTDDCYDSTYQTPSRKESQLQKIEL